MSILLSLAAKTIPMGDGKPNIIEKSYKLLFVIYAPVALLGYIINAIGGFKMSFLTIFLLLVTALSVIIALILIVRYTMLRGKIISMPDVNKNAPYFFRHDFLIPFIFISVTSFTILSFLAYNGVINEFANKIEIIETNHKDEKPRILLLLGLSNTNNFQETPTLQNTLLDYGASEIQGLSFYRRYSKEHGNNYHFQIVDHGQKYSSKMENTIKEALKDGVRYFICTTSSISVPLSRKFEQLIAETNASDNNPILICTNSGSPEVETKANFVYRFYPRSEDEAIVLAEKGNQMHFEKIVYIAINDEYGKGAVSSFEKEWRKNGHILSDGIYLDPALSEENILNKIKNSNLLKQEPDAIFIANSGSSLQSTIRAISDFPDDIAILGTTGLSVKFTQAPIKHILNKKQWYTCVPDSKSKDDIISFDLNTSFLYMSIDKLTNAIESVKQNPETTIHDELTRQDFPILLNFDYDKHGDFNIDLRIDSILINRLNTSE